MRELQLVPCQPQPWRFTVTDSATTTTDLDIAVLLGDHSVSRSTPCPALDRDGTLPGCERVALLELKAKTSRPNWLRPPSGRQRRTIITVHKGGTVEMATLRLDPQGIHKGLLLRKMMAASIRWHQTRVSAVCRWRRIQNGLV